MLICLLPASHTHLGRGLTTNFASEVMSGAQQRMHLKSQTVDNAERRSDTRQAAAVAFIQF